MQVNEGKKAKLYVIPIERAKALEVFLQEYEVRRKISFDRSFDKEIDTSTPSGELLRTLRENLELNQAELAVKVKSTRESINRMENGPRQISVKMANQLSEFFDIDHRYFL